VMLADILTFLCRQFNIEIVPDIHNCLFVSCYLPLIAHLVIAVVCVYMCMYRQCCKWLIMPFKIKIGKGKVKQSLYRPVGFQEVEALRFQDNRHMQVVR
jgi:hypothetical protein